MLYAVILFKYSSPDWRPMITGYLGVALGVAGWIQNRLRRKRYLRMQQLIAEKLSEDEKAP